MTSHSNIPAGAQIYPPPQSSRVPIIELFGPTIQGEGVMSGTLSHFLRTGGCPLKCSWCDSMYAVDPKEVQKNAHWMDGGDVLRAIKKLPYAPYITFTGGDPCMWEELGAIIPWINLHLEMQVAIETQGTLFPDWLELCDVITFSPKPPSSGNAVAIEPLIDYLRSRTRRKVCIKVVVFDKPDFDYAMYAYRALNPSYYDAFYFTAGTPMWTNTSDVKGEFRATNVLRSMRRLTDMLLEQQSAQPVFNHKVHVGCQQHVLLWPNEDKGV